MKFLIIFLTVLSCFGAQQPPATWQLYKWALNGNGDYTPVSAPGSGGDVATFAFGASTKPYAAFLTTIVDTNLLGDLTGKQLTATVSVSGSATFVYGGQFSWNSNSTVPANTRLYFSTSAATYDIDIANTNSTAFWWSHYGVCVITNGAGGIIADTFTPSHWSDANGHPGDDPGYIDAFNAAVANVQQIGVSFGGGSFFDCGVALWPHTGSASFHLVSFTAN